MIPTIFLAMSLTVSGCASIIPDYTAKKFIDRGYREPLVVTSNVFGPTCGPRLVIIRADLRQPGPILIIVNGKHILRFPDKGEAAILNLNAGLGPYEIVIVGGGRKIIKRFTVYRCIGGGK